MGISAITRKLQKASLYYQKVNKVRKYYTKKLTDARKHLLLEPETPARGSVLLSYKLEPFLLKPGQPVQHWHSNFSESLEMAQTFLELGFEVDVFEYNNDIYMPAKKEYDFFIDSRWNFERLAPQINQDCLKIKHIDVAHILFQNFAEARRLLELQQRRGVTLQPHRYEVPNQAIEYADCATVLGNKFTLDTFAYAKKPLYPVPIITPVLYPWSAEKDFEACRKHFLWFGSYGMVRKGLDIALEAFAQMPDYELTVCGPINQEKDFESAYYKELYETPNIHTKAWIDIKSDEFTQITNSCLGLIFPSCCEGQCGGVVQCMQAGLIPVISYESGVDVFDFGLILETSTIEEVKEAVRKVAGLPAADLETMSRKSWEYARANHTRERFGEKYRQAITGIIAAFRPGLALPAPEHSIAVEQYINRSNIAS